MRLTLKAQKNLFNEITAENSLKLERHLNTRNI